MGLANKIGFALEGGLTDLVNRVTPMIFSRSSPVNLERVVNDGVQFDAIPAYAPGIFSDDGSFLLEPSTVNLLTWNMDLTQNVWEKGGNVQVRPNIVLTPTGSSLEADQIRWAGGTGNTQLFQRNLVLEAATTYTLSWLLRLPVRGGRFGANDVLRVVGGVVGTPSLTLTTLNNFPDRYRILELQFRTTGTQPTLPSLGVESIYSITSVSATQFIVSGLEGVSANALVGGQATFDNVSNTYLITANTASSSGFVTVTVAATNLVGDGVTTASRASFLGAPEQTCTVQFYCESTASLDVGGANLEELGFRTSTVYQRGEPQVRAATLLTYQSSPVENLTTFGVFVDLRLWRGDGLIVDLGNFRIDIVGGKVQVTAGSTTLTDPDPLPKGKALFFAQVSAEGANLSLYINQVLKARTGLAGFKGSTAQMQFSTIGVRAYKRFLTTIALLTDGQAGLGAAAGQEIGELFSNPNLIEAEVLASGTPQIILPSVTIPAPPAPLARAIVTSVNTGTNVLGIASSTGFVVGDSVAILRGSRVIRWANITATTANSLTADTVAGVVVGDLIVKGNVDQPGSASIRLPFTPIDPQIIQSVNTGTSAVTVASTLSFTRQRAIVQTSDFQDVREVLIEAIDTANSVLTLNSVDQVTVGQVISQPQSEKLIDPQAYLVQFTQPIPGVRISRKAQNGFVVENFNPVDVVVTPVVQVFQ